MREGPITFTREVAGVQPLLVLQTFALARAMGEASAREDRFLTRDVRAVA